MQFGFMDNKAKTQSNLSEDEKIDWLRLARTDNVGPVTFYRLIEAYGSAKRALEVLPELSKRGGGKKTLIPASERQAEQEYKALTKIKGRLITAACEDYPLALAATSDAPPVISVLGNPALMARSCIAMVGARNASLNGRKFAEKLARELGAAGQVVVSGLARGIDTAAHHGALQTGTIAVVAGGIDIIYPEENAGLYDRIKENGLIVAESPLGQKPFAQSFPRRNRIVSGLSKGVIVVEATMRSGSLITARLAGEQGRDVYAVPGHPLDPRAQGPNHLIREGATLVQSAADVLEMLRPIDARMLREPGRGWVHDSDAFGTDADDADRRRITGLLGPVPVPVDELVRQSGCAAGVVSLVLLELELAGRLERHAGGRVSGG